MKDGGDPRELWACWSVPSILPDRASAVLSFLSPAEEYLFEQAYTGPLIRARETVQSVRNEARQLYIELVARIGLAPCGDQTTLRVALTPSEKASRWWYHPVAFKDCESDPTFQLIIAVHTILAVAEEHGLNKLVLFGGPCEVAAVLKSAFSVKEVVPRRSRWSWSIWGRGLASRVRYGLRTMYEWVAVRRLSRHFSGTFDVVFSGYWDWSVWWDSRKKTFVDRYFGGVPDRLRAQGMPAIGWIAWLDLRSKPRKERRTLADVLAPLEERDDLVILQALLRPRDIVRAVGDFWPLKTFLRIRKGTPFRQLFQSEGLDYYSLFKDRLLQGFLNASLPHCTLVAMATERACRRYKPRVALSFLEHFPYARAHYEGARRGSDGITLCAVQHASYNHEKTFLFLHPSIEFDGEPDGCATPHPDYVFAMGSLGQELFLECGYPKDRVVVTGSTRYDYLRVEAGGTFAMSGVAGGETTVLIACGHAVDQELDMVEAACAAMEGLTAIRLLLRSHPFSRVDKHPRFKDFRRLLTVVDGCLDDNLSQSDLVLFTYSTVAEEALLMGKPVWQWLPWQLNGSALAETHAIPKFGSVTGLRKALQDFQAYPAQFLPPEHLRRAVCERLFYRTDGGAAVRVAGVVQAMVQGHVPEQAIS